VATGFYKDALIDLVAEGAGVGMSRAEVDALVTRARDVDGVKLVVERLPKTRSGKILRGTMRHIADGEDYRMPATIDDPAILAEIGEALARAGYPQKHAT